MPIHNSILSNKNKEVNTFFEDVLEISKEIDKELGQEESFYKLVPKIHKSAVRNLVKTQFNNNLEEYKKTIPLFFDSNVWNEKKRVLADDKVITNKSNREKKKNQKALLLHSAQLLKLIGHSRQKVATKALIKFYVEDMEESDEYLKALRLINANGSIIEIESIEEKQRRELAYRLKVCDAMDRIAQDRGYSNALITLTLPPVFHPAPKNGNCSYNGATPEKAKARIMDYWKKFRARLSNKGLVFGEDILGLQVIECQQDSTLHLHTVLYCSVENLVIVEECLLATQNKANQKATIKQELVNFDFKPSNPDSETFQRGSSYLMKYLTKTHTVYTDNQEDDGALRNQTARWFYGVRGFNFYGLEGALTKFNFLVKNFKAYKPLLSEEINLALENADLYSFIKFYAGFFEPKYQKQEGQAKKFAGVLFLKGIYRKQARKNKKDKNKQLELLISKVKNEASKLEARLNEARKNEDNRAIFNLSNRLEKKYQLLKGLFSTNSTADIEIKKKLGNVDFVFVEKKLFSLFQSCEDSKEVKNINNIPNLDLLPNIQCAYDSVCLKQNDFNVYLEVFEKEQEDKGIKVAFLKDIEEIRRSIDKSIVVQLIKGIQGKGFKPKEEEKEQAIEEIHYQNWLEQHQIFS